MVKKFSEDRKLISSGELKGMVFKAIPGSPSLTILNQVCAMSELTPVCHPPNNSLEPQQVADTVCSEWHYIHLIFGSNDELL
ncbi:MAG: hypothetical protein ACYC2E_05995, partial [Sulfuricella sp.]